MATIQASLIVPSRLTSLSATSSVSSRTRVDCKTWVPRRSSGQQQRRSLAIRASSSDQNAAPGVSGSEVPLGGGVTTAPLSQKDVPKAERIAYVCSACGYIYDLDTPFEEQPDSYACPVCTAPKDDFSPSNATLGEGVFDPTKKGDASSN